MAAVTWARHADGCLLCPDLGADAPALARLDAGPHLHVGRCVRISGWGSLAYVVIIGSSMASVVMVLRSAGAYFLGWGAPSWFLAVVLVGVVAVGSALHETGHLMARRLLDPASSDQVTLHLGAQPMVVGPDISGRQLGLVAAAGPAMAVVTALVAAGVGHALAGHVACPYTAAVVLGVVAIGQLLPVPHSDGAHIVNVLRGRA